MDSKQYYSISEVEKIVNIPQSKLRFWEKNIDKLSPKRSKGSTRKYSAEDIDIIKQIILDTTGLLTMLEILIFIKFNLCFLIL